MSVAGEATARPPARRTSSLKMFGKHQLASAAATAVDYVTMIAMVSLIGLGPVAGTAIGAAVGAVTNFTLGRNFTFRSQARGRGVPGQFIRYVIVSALSLLWNALGVHVVAVQLGVQYVLARLIVGTLVGFVWNFPMHRYFVFRA